MAQSTPDSQTAPALDVETIRVALTQDKQIDWRQAAEFLLIRLDESERQAANFLQIARDEAWDGVLDDD